MEDIKKYSKKEVEWIIDKMYKEFCSGTGLEYELDMFKKQVGIKE